MATELSSKVDLSGKKLLLRPGDFYELGSERSLPLAMVIQERLVLEMSGKGAEILHPGVEALPEFLIQGQWHTEGETLKLTLNLVRFTGATPEIVAVSSGGVDLGAIASQLMKPDLASWGRYLVRRLETQATGKPRLTVYLAPFRVLDAARPEELGEYLSDWLRPPLVESLSFVPIDVPLALAQLNVADLHTRGQSKPTPEPAGAVLTDAQFEEDGLSLTGDLVSAQAELVGKAYLGREELEVRVHIHDAKGVQVAAADARFPKRLLPRRLVGSKDAGGEPEDDRFSLGGLNLELATTRGESRAEYRAGDRIRFIVRVDSPAYIYLFNRDSAGRTALLYPLPGVRESPLDAGKALVLPDDGLPYELIVEPPFGEDYVWAVAAEAPLDLSESPSGEWFDFGTLKYRLRTQASSGGRGYAEAGVHVATAP